MKKIHFATLMLLSGLVACNQSTNAHTNSATSNPPSASSTQAIIQQDVVSATQSVASAVASQPLATAKPTTQATGRYADFIQLTQNLQKQLVHATPKQADQLYEQHKKQVDVLVTKYFEKSEEAFINTHYHNEENWQISPNGETHTPIGILKQRMDELADAGLEYWYIGEGMVDLRPQADYYQKLFKNKTSPDVAAYIQLNAEDDKILVFNDAAVIVPWQELGKRAAQWENFARQYPNSRYAKEATSHFHHYAYNFLFGSDNTLVMGSDKEMFALVEKAWAEFVQTYPNSTIVPMIPKAKQMTQTLNYENMSNADRIEAMNQFTKQYLSSVYRHEEGVQ